MRSTDANLYKIREASIHDLDGICRIEEDAFNSTRYNIFTKQQFRHFITAPSAILLIAENNTDILSYGIILIKKNTNYGRFYSLAVSPKAQGIGIGSAMFKAAEDAAKNARKKGMICEIREDNNTLLQRYSKLGYRVKYVAKNYYPDGCSGIKMIREFE